MNQQQMAVLLTVVVATGLLLAGMVVGWTMRGWEVKVWKEFQRREDERWRTTYEEALQRVHQRTGEWAAERDGLTRELRDLQRERADLKYQLGTQRGQGKVSLLEDGPEEGWVLSDEHEYEVQRARRRADGGASVDSSVVNHLLDS